MDRGMDVLTPNCSPGALEPWSLPSCPLHATTHKICTTVKRPRRLLESTPCSTLCRLALCHTLSNIRRRGRHLCDNTITILRLLWHHQEDIRKMAPTEDTATAA